MQRLEFIIGDAGRRSHFASEAERRAAWEVHRDALMRRRRIPGRRIAAWWQYQTRELRNYAGGEHETLQLLRLGVLDDGELPQLRAQWARDVEVMRLNFGTPPGEPLPVEDDHLWGVPGWFIEAKRIGSWPKTATTRLSGARGEKRPCQ